MAYSTFDRISVSMLAIKSLKYSFSAYLMAQKEAMGVTGFHISMKSD